VRLPPAMKEWRRKQPQVKSAQVAQVVKLDKASLHRQEDRDKYTEAVGEFVGGDTPQHQGEAFAFIF